MKITTTAFILCLAVLIGGCSGQKLSPGSCPSIQSLGITLAPLVATWREQARTPSIFNHKWRCVTYRIDVVTAAVQYSVIIDGATKGSWKANRLSGIIDIIGTTSASTTLPVTSTLSLTIYGRPFNKSLRYYVVGTDVLATPTYLVLYACEEAYPFGKLESALILSSITITPSSYALAVNSLAAVGYDVNKLERTFSGGCLA